MAAAAVVAAAMVPVTVVVVPDNGSSHGRTTQAAHSTGLTRADEGPQFNVLIQRAAATASGEKRILQISK